MSKVQLSRLMVLCAALAACSTADTNRTLTAPDAGPARSEATADLGFSTTVDGAYDVVFANEAASTQMAASLPQAAAGGRTSGHAGFTFTTPVLGITSEQYSFSAVSTDPSTFAAKGQFEMQLTSATGVQQKFHGDVVCMNTVGNVTRLAGQLTKVWVNNVQRPINAATHVIWTVVDNGEGQGATDTASFMFFNNATNAQTHCSTGFSPLQLNNQEGNIQVTP